jgi:glycosyltransferase involved in cell wall biosynthesis
LFATGNPHKRIPPFGRGRSLRAAAFGVGRGGRNRLGRQYAPAVASETVVFIPAWNEERSLPAVLDELRVELPDADVLVIDDGSTDATAEVAASHGAIVVSFGENRGLRAGIAAGYREADVRGYAYCGRVDADGQHPAHELRRLLELVRSDRCDVAVGSRFAEGEGYETERYAPSRSRRFGIGLLQKAMHVRLGRPFHDPTSGMAAVNRKAMPIMARPYVSGAPEVEALLRLKHAGLRVEEVAVHMREREHGESKLQGKKAVKLVLTVVGTLLFFRWLRHRRS